MEKFFKHLRLKKLLFTQDQFTEFRKLLDMIWLEIIEKHMVCFVVVAFYLIMSLQEEDSSSLQEKLLTLLQELNMVYKKI